MRVKMLKRAPISPNGINIVDAHPDDEYDLPHDMATAMARDGLCELLEEVAVEAEEEEPDPTDDSEVEKEQDPNEPAEGRGEHWEKSMPPATYLDRWPEGPAAPLARWVLGEGADDEMPNGEDED